MKYLCWGGISLYFYHLWACTHYENPEDFTHDERFLYAAMWTRVAYRDLYELLTQPPVKALLGERFIPPGYAARPTLVLSVNGVLVHSEYKFGIGFEITKRPGLSAFVNRMSRSYDVHLFGDQEQGHI